LGIGTGRIEVRLQHDRPAIGVLDHDALWTAETGSLNGSLGDESGGCEVCERVEMGWGGGRGNEGMEGVIGEVEGESWVLRGEVGHVCFIGKLLLCSSFSTPEKEERSRWMA
jgi:hypothetical protein